MATISDFLVTVGLCYWVLKPYWLHKMVLKHLLEFVTVYRLNGVRNESVRCGIIASYLALFSL